MICHFNYVIGAYTGSLIGSFFVHVFDSIATRHFARTPSSFLKLTKAVFKSYLPVGLWVVPARTLALGVFSVAQDMLDICGFGYPSQVLLSSILSGLSLAVLSTPAELIKTRQQLEMCPNKITAHELKKSFVPLSMRVMPTVGMMLAGTSFIQPYMPFESIIISTSLSAVTAASISHLFATPAENIRIYRINKEDYEISTRDLLKQLWRSKTLFRGYSARALSLGVQAAFSLSAANSMGALK